MQTLTAPSFIEIIKSGYSNCFNFTGRARRAEYWWFVLYSFIVLIVASILSLQLIFALDTPSIGMMLYAISVLLVTIPTISLAVRRLHDTDRSGWWLLISFIPLGGIVLLVFLTNDSFLAENKWGISPKYVDSSF